MKEIAGLKDQIAALKDSTNEERHRSEMEIKAVQTQNTQLLIQSQEQLKKMTQEKEDFIEEEKNTRITEKAKT